MWWFGGCESREDGPRRRRWRTRDLLIEALGQLSHIATQLDLMEARMTATQDKIDALSATLSEVQTTFAEAADGIRSDIAALKAQVEAGESPDFSALDARVEALGAQAAALSALDAENPAPEPEPEPEG